MKKLWSYSSWLLVILLLTTGALKAQNGKTGLPDTITVARMAADLSISKQKAWQLFAILNYRHAELTAVRADPNLPIAQKQLIMNKLLTERHRRIDSLLTPVQQALLLQRESGAIQQSMAAAALVRQRHEAEMNRVPHQESPRLIVNPDTTKKKKS